MAECWPRSVVDGVRAALLGPGGLELKRSSRALVHRSKRGECVAQRELEQARLVLKLEWEAELAESSPSAPPPNRYSQRLGRKG